MKTGKMYSPTVEECHLHCDTDVFNLSNIDHSIILIIIQITNTIYGMF